jgi:hypothetical protein
MKKLGLILLVPVIVLAACVKENTPTTGEEEVVDTMFAVSKYSGTFVNGPYGAVSGTARIYLQNGQYILALENFSSTNGPDLHVYLSREVQPVNYIDLGRLKSVSGNQLYPLTGNVDFTYYKYALIHCQRYNHLFGSAELK